MITAAEAREITNNSDKYIRIKEKVERLSLAIEERAEQGYSHIVVLVLPEDENLYTNILKRLGYKVEKQYCDLYKVSDLYKISW